ncbi:CGNR zinc finger domain-containing protein [Nonomuraea rubra]|uniref:Putative RNA-binding Zn ribbon-like protein n=1 Tax=Nonomuraea rubra TaxID=46180 RepID=A0A7X0NTZ2_9ACTN|nr:CGNR zinc finger domain-containing protein [Nonomuraea rubra]MBB6549560.1 putative RNA-binding Zn ribbon-like protein [Nonomuraea rubra]
MTKAASPDEELLLALLNTTPTVAGEVQDRLDDPEEARSWIAEHAGEGHHDEDLGLLRSTRDTLQALVRGRAAPAALAPALSGVSYQPVPGDTGLSWRLVTPREHALAARAVVAWDALRQTAPGRLRSCENTDECTLFFVDHSKSNSARWCSMAGCGNRMKARRHYERRKNAQTID